MRMVTSAGLAGTSIEADDQGLGLPGKGFAQPPRPVNNSPAPARRKSRRGQVFLVIVPLSSKEVSSPVRVRFAYARNVLGNSALNPRTLQFVLEKLSKEFANFHPPLVQGLNATLCSPIESPKSSVRKLPA